MKIDIEGSDFVCLKSLNKFESVPNYISIESSKLSIENFASEIEMFKKIGYDSFMIVQQQNISKIKLPNKSMEGKTIKHQFRKDSSGLFGKELQGVWQYSREIIEDYQLIIKRYERFGDNTFWRQNKISKLFIELIEIISGIPLPGWYDTHAKHSSVS